jgi:hypothetical protein
MSAGMLLFGRYAYPPNRLGYCGPAEHEALLAYVSEERVEEGLRALERRFEGAYPYLTLIARANGVADPLDERIVTAYWIGNECLDQVDGVTFAAEQDLHAKAQLGAKASAWLTPELAGEAKPHHLFTVLDLYMRTGMLRDARAGVILRTVDGCRISWGRVTSMDGEEIEVARPRLVLCDGTLALAAPETFRVRRASEGRGLLRRVRPGDVVSIHWDWACDVLTRPDAERLMALTERSLALVNASLRDEMRQVRAVSG